MTSNQTIDGVKTFIRPPVVPANAFPSAAVAGLITDLAAKAPLAGPFAPSTLGASSVTRYVGGTADGAPTTGTFAVGDFVIDRTGKVWICTAAGTPGIWSRPSGSGVDLTTDQRIGGVKTFTAAPVVPDASFPQAAVAGLASDLATKQAVIPPGTFVEKTETATGAIGAPDPLTLFSLQPRDPDRAKFRLINHGASFTNDLGTAWDDVFTLGYNVAAGGSKEIAAEPSMVWQVETNYYSPGGKAWVECFWQYSPPNEAFGAIRPIAVNYDRNADTAASANAVGMLLSAESFSFVTADGTKKLATIGQNGMELGAPKARNNGLRLIGASGFATYIALDHGTAAQVLVLAADSPTYGSLRVGGSPIAYFLSTAGGGLQIAGRVGFYNKAPVAKPTGVAVTAAGIHAALVTLGLIGA